MNCHIHTDIVRVPLNSRKWIFNLFVWINLGFCFEIIPPLTPPWHFPSLSHVSCPVVWWNVIITPGCRDENFHNGEILFNRAEMLNCHLLICWNLWQGLMDGVDTLTLFFLQSYFPFLNILLIFVWKTI